MPLQLCFPTPVGRRQGPFQGLPVLQAPLDPAPLLSPLPEPPLPPSPKLQAWGGGWNWGPHLLGDIKQIAALSEPVSSVTWDSIPPASQGNWVDGDSARGCSREMATWALPWAPVPAHLPPKLHILLETAWAQQGPAGPTAQGTGSPPASGMQRPL